MAVNSAGIAVAVWHQSDGTHNHIWSNRYEPYVLPEFPNTVLPVVGVIFVCLICLIDSRRRNS